MKLEKPGFDQTSLPFSIHGILLPQPWDSLSMGCSSLNTRLWISTAIGIRDIFPVVKQLLAIAGISTYEGRKRLGLDPAFSMIIYTMG